MKKSWRILFLSVYLSLSLCFEFLKIRGDLSLKNHTNLPCAVRPVSPVKTSSQYFLCGIEFYVSLASEEVWAFLQIIIWRTHLFLNFCGVSQVSYKIWSGLSTESPPELRPPHQMLLTCPGVSVSGPCSQSMNLKLFGFSL